jgi:hypothetical protein
MGDIMTIGNNRLVLFLSFCRVNDLDTALNHIFPLPTGDIFSNRMVWFEDKQITAEIVQMRGFCRRTGTRRCLLRWRKMKPSTPPMTDAAGDAFRSRTACPPTGRKPS